MSRVGLGAGDPGLDPSTDLEVARAAVLGAPGGDEVMEAHRRTVLAALDDPEVADRRARPSHLTGSALVVDAEHRRIVLLLHRKLGRWLQPGGHADGDTNLARVAWREATEETGIDGLVIDPVALDVDVHRVAPPGEDPHLHLDVRYLALAPPEARLVGNEESAGLRWVEFPALDDYDLDRGLMRLVAAARARLGHVI